MEVTGGLPTVWHYRTYCWAMEAAEKGNAELVGVYRRLLTEEEQMEVDTKLHKSLVQEKKRDVLNEMWARLQGMGRIERGRLVLEVDGQLWAVDLKPVKRVRKYK